jgi:transposase
MMAKDPAVLSSDEADAVGRIAQDKEAATMITLVQRFASLIRASSIAAASPHRAPLRAFQRWTRDANTSGLRAMMTFATALQNDTAVQAALSTPWSNAQCEGHITRLKLLKRQMYGRASLDLLHRRMLLAT